MTAVIDVSGAVELLLLKEKAGVFYKALQKASIIITPNLYISELTNTFWKYYSAKMQTKDECEQLIHDGINLINEFISAKDIWQEAFSEGINNNHSIYDMLYMVVARRHDGTLITNDSALAAVCKKYKIKVCCN